jgi:A/G-specific adenine glycosylase
MTSAVQKNNFKKILLKWNRDKNSRDMPWKGEKDPYKIWLSEIILQQTRVGQGLDYYNRFVKEFPDINRLAKASDKKVFKMWEGLGYYSRCRNLLVTARYISKERKGEFPNSYDEIKDLKGIGPYTASAISSFAFNLPHAAVDGNVFRVLARVFGIKTATDTTEGKKQFTVLAEELLDKKQPGIYNQSIMDFGAVVCKPASPLCQSCPFCKSCFAYLNDQIESLPVKEKKITIKTRWFYYLVPEHNGELFIHQRTGKDIWHHLYEFYLFEAKKKISLRQITEQALKSGINAGPLQISPVYTQQLSHQYINAVFIPLHLKQKPSLLKAGQWVKKSKLRQFAFPGVIRDFLKNF